MKTSGFACSLLLLLVHTSFAAEKKQLTPENFERVSAVYAKIVGQLAQAHPKYQKMYNPILRKDQAYIEYQSAFFSDVIVAGGILSDGSILVVLNKDTLEVLSLNNLPVWNYYMSSESKSEANRQRIPKWNYESAVVAARKYLEAVNVKVPDGFILNCISFDTWFHSRWEVRWQPAFSHIPYDNGQLYNYPQSICVIFTESGELESVTSASPIVFPASKEIKIDEESAIIKASRCAPLVMETPFYKQRREGGFVIKSMKEVKLVVNTPNWLLDPNRAIWMTKEPPKEARIAWKVVFSTVDGQEIYDSKDSKRASLKLSPPDIIVFIDAATGECVGANFT